MKNRELALKGLAHIKENPHLWSQRFFFDYDKACFGGRVILIHFGFTTEAEVDAYRHGQCSQTGFYPHADEIAAELLGMTEAEAHDIFYFFTTDYDELERAVLAALDNDE